MIPFPDKKYSVIYADPAWQHPKGNRGREDAIFTPYQTMTFKELEKLPMQDICEKDCMLFLWVVTPMLLDCIDIAKKWGFDYSTIAFVWDKQLPVIGTYTLSQVELCMLFKRGKIPQPRGKRNIRQFLSVKKGKHSVKPYEVRQRITEMFPHHEKIELFARERFDGWDAWGNEV